MIKEILSPLLLYCTYNYWTYFWDHLFIQLYWNFWVYKDEEIQKEQNKM